MPTSSDRALDLVLQLMAIPGRSGEEGAVAAFIEERLRQAGAADDAITTDNAHKKTSSSGEVGNLILRLPGTVRKPRRMLVAHIDTVPICVGSKPKRKGDIVRSANPATGLGADNRAGATVLLNTALEILENKLPHPPLTFLWPIQEETGLIGARHVRLSALGKVAIAFNFDGGAPGKITIGATGGYRLGIEVRGLASHAGGAPEKGISAVAIAALAIADLHRGGWHGDVHKDGRHGTSNVGVIEGGQATNVVTDHVYLRAEARSHEPRFRQRIVKEIEQAFERAAAEVKNCDGQVGSVHFNGSLDYEAFRLNPDEPCVQKAMAAVEQVGLEPELAIANGGLDANWLTARGISTVSLGCGQRNIHTVSEELDVAQFRQACRIARALATDVT